MGEAYDIVIRGGRVATASDVFDADVPIAGESFTLIEKGTRSRKRLMTYDRLKGEDEELLDVLAVARKSRAMVCVHAENHGVISWMVKRLLAHGHTAPKFHAASHARIAESEAINRL